MTDAQTPLHAIIVGCGRVGSGMARRLTDEGYTVTVIDRTTRAFSRLDGCSAERLIGMGYDRGTLLEAGIERAEVLAAVTNGDNTNIVVARTAREHFQVPKVVARIYDPRRAAIYERLGISTVASAQLTTELAVRRVLPDDAGVRWVDPSANVCLVDRSVPPTLAGHALTDIERSGQVRVMAVRRLGVGMVATPDLVFQEGDVVYLSVANDQLDAVDGLLSPDAADELPRGRSLMRVLIVGAGKVGTFIAADLAAAGHEVSIIERTHERVERLRLRSDLDHVDWVVADACEVTQLATAHPQTADVFVAVTGDDEDNLVSSLLAKQEFGVPRVLARVEPPGQRMAVHERLGHRPRRVGASSAVRSGPGGRHGGFGGPSPRSRRECPPRRGDLGRGCSRRRGTDRPHQLPT